MSVTEHIQNREGSKPPQYSWISAALVFCLAAVPNLSFTGLNKLRIADVLLVGLLLYLYMRPSPPSTPKFPLVRPMMLVCCWNVLCLVLTDAPVGLGAAVVAKRVELCALTYAAFRVGQRSPNDRATIASLILSGCTVALLILLELCLKLSLPHRFVGNKLRSAGLFFGLEHMQSGLIILFGLFAALACWTSKRSRLLSLAACLSGIGIALTGTRSLLVAAVCGVLALATRSITDKRARGRVLGAFAIAVLAAHLCSPATFRERLGRFGPELVAAARTAWTPNEVLVSEYSLAARVAAARLVVTDTLKQAPFTGRGPASVQLGTVDNFWATELTYFGIPGVLGTAWILVGTGIALCAAVAAPSSKAIAVATLGCFAAMLATTVVADTFYLIRPAELFMFCVGYTLGRCSVSEREDEGAILSRPVPVAAILLTGACLLLPGLAGLFHPVPYAARGAVDNPTNDQLRPAWNVRLVRIPLSPGALSSQSLRAYLDSLHVQHSMALLEVPCAEDGAALKQVVAETLNHPALWAYGLRDETKNAAWKQVSQAAVDHIRSTGSVHTIVVGGADHSTSLEWVSVNGTETWIKDPRANVCYAAACHLDHDNSGTHRLPFSEEVARDPRLTGRAVRRTMPFSSWCRNNLVQGVLTEIPCPPGAGWCAELQLLLRHCDAANLGAVVLPLTEQGEVYKPHEGASPPPQIGVLQSSPRLPDSPARRFKAGYARLAYKAGDVLRSIRRRAR